MSIVVLLAGCPEDRLQEGLSVVVKSDGVYFQFDRYDVIFLEIYARKEGRIKLMLYGRVKFDEINNSNNMVRIGNQSNRWKHGGNFVYGDNYFYQIDTTGKSWHGFIQFNHKDPSMAGEDVDFEDTSKMKVTFIIDHFGKEVKRMEVKGSDYDE
ncbi:MAG: hypothetical protein JXK07_02125 [Spirochaetes bacterium]|nr:hypothetical protein [Spirochaetota bacterium]